VAREIVIKCEKHPERPGEEVVITIGGVSVEVDLCAEDREPLEELMRLGRPATGVLTTGRGTTQNDRGMAARIRGVPPLEH
jgi:hypothetical protein